MATIRILIVDNDTSVLEFLREGIEHGLPEAAVEIFASPQWALERIRRADFHVVLSEVVMAEMNGIEMMRRMMDMGQHPAPTTVLITGNSAWMPMAIDAGAYTCLPKPVPLDCLAGTLRRAIDYNCLARRIERSSQVLAFQTRTTNEYREQVHAHTEWVEKRMTELRKLELDRLIAFWARHPLWTWYPQNELSAFEPMAVEADDARDGLIPAPTGTSASC